MTIYFPKMSGYLGIKPSKTTDKFIVIDGEIQEIHKVVVHKFKLRDVDDPEIHAVGPILDWKESEYGQWIFEHAIESPEWHRQDDAMSFHTDFLITAKLKDKDYVIWVLKYT